MVALQQIGKENLSERVYHTIRGALIDGQYKPGERLRISALAAELGTSITPVREAIFRLISEQALEMKAATAIHVPRIDADQLREIQIIRSHLEGEAAARAAKRITNAQLAELEAIQDAFIEAAHVDSRLASIRNRDFHFFLLKTAGLPLVETIVENLWIKMGPLLLIFNSLLPLREIASTQHKHFAVLDALRKHDAEGARKAMQSDIAWGSILVDWLESNDKEVDWQV